MSEPLSVLSIEKEYKRICQSALKNTLDENIYVYYPLYTTNDKCNQAISFSELNMLLCTFYLNIIYISNWLYLVDLELII